jgi:hypothetical protein
MDGKSSSVNKKEWRELISLRKRRNDEIESGFRNTSWNSSFGQVDIAT